MAFTWHQIEICIQNDYEHESTWKCRSSSASSTNFIRPKRFQMVPSVFLILHQFLVVAAVGPVELLRSMESMALRLDWRPKKNLMTFNGWVPACHTTVFVQLAYVVPVSECVLPVSKYPLLVYWTIATYGEWHRYISNNSRIINNWLTWWRKPGPRRKNHWIGNKKYFEIKCSFSRVTTLSATRHNPPE